MNRKAQSRRWRKSHAVTSDNALNWLVEILALDRAIVELSMSIYRMPQRDRAAIRGQNRRLHNAVREHLAPLLKPAQRPFE